MLVVTAVLSLFGCSEETLEISEDEAFAVLSDLVPKSYEINRILFGEGLPAVDEAYTETKNGTAYFDVKDGSGYSSKAEIKAAAEKVYSKRYLDGVYVYAFEGVALESGEENLDLMVSPRYTEIGGKLKVDINSEHVAIRNKLTVISSEIVKKTAEYVKLNAVCREDGNDAEFQVTMLITLENNVWLLDGPTY